MSRVRRIKSKLTKRVRGPAMLFNFDEHAVGLDGEEINARIDGDTGKTTWRQLIRTALNQRAIVMGPQGSMPEPQLSLEEKLKRGDLIRKILKGGWIDLDPDEQKIIRDRVAAVWDGVEIACGVDDILKNKGRQPQPPAQEAVAQQAPG